MSSKIVKYRKVGDLGNPLQAKLLNRTDRSAINLTSYTGVDFVMTQINDDSTVTELINAAATITDAAAGEIEYQWQAGDTSTAGSFQARFVAIDGSGNQETFPAKGYIEIRIEALP